MKLGKKEVLDKSKPFSRGWVEMGESVAKFLPGIAKTGHMVFLKCTCSPLKFMRVSLLAMLHKSLPPVQQFHVTFAHFLQSAGL